MLDSLILDNYLEARYVVLLLDLLDLTPVYKSVSISRETPKKKADVVAKLQSGLAKLSNKKDDV